MMSECERDGILAGVRTALSLEELSVTHVEVRALGDGSERWVILTDALDPNGRSCTYRTIVTADGAVAAPELLRA